MDPNKERRLEDFKKVSAFMRDTLREVEALLRRENYPASARETIGELRSHCSPGEFTGGLHGPNGRSEPIPISADPLDHAILLEDVLDAELVALTPSSRR